MKKFPILVAAAMLGCVLAGSAFADSNAMAGQAKAKLMCAACHGARGMHPTAPNYPILGGQYYDYLVRALEDYKSGKRKNAIMNGMAATLSVSDIHNLAAWFSSQHSTLHTPSVSLHFE